MKILKDIASLQAWRKKQSKKENSIGLIPTMGALHAGHLELVKTARKDCDRIVVSIFVNPTQFNSSEDLKNYPRTLENDLKLLKAAKVSAVFLPSEDMLYPDGFRYKVTEDVESRILCGAHRPGHFTGVLTVVLKLLNLVQPQQAFFGEKDFQQFKLIEEMAAAFFLTTKIIAVPTVREKTGLALSSRNARLGPAQLKKAQKISRLLADKKLSPKKIREQLTQEGFDVDYVEDHWNRRFVAAQIQGVRLIDNTPLKVSKRS